MEERMKRCPYCDEEIRANAIKCKHCGSFISDDPRSMRDTTVRQALMARYDVLEEIGRGGMGVVYKATQKNLNRLVALKVLPQQLTADSEYLQRFHGEARKAAQLSHPNIITIYDEGVENGVHYIAMEYIEGRDLREIILRESPLAVEQVLKWIKPIAEGLGYAHNKGLIHRDIKSANILISKEGRPVLTDFGIARSVMSNDATQPAEMAQLTRPGMIMGTLQYMGPEQIQGKPVDARSDIYSLGVVLYQCLTGELPFRGDTDWSTMHKIATITPTPLRGLRAEVPKPVESLVMRCMAKDPAKRYQRCEELVQAMDEALAEIQAPRKTSTKPVPAPDDTVFDIPPVRKAEPKNWFQPISQWAAAAVASKKWRLGTAGVAALALAAVVLLNLPLRNERESEDSFSSEQKRLMAASFAAGDSLYEQGAWIKPAGENAYEKYRGVLDIDPENAEAEGKLDSVRARVISQARELVEENERQQAEATLVDAARRFPDDDYFARSLQWLEVFALEVEATRYASKKQYVAPAGANAYETCQSVINLDPGNETAQRIMQEIHDWFADEGEKALAKKDFRKAVGIYERALRHFPDDAEFLEKHKWSAKESKSEIDTKKIEKMLAQGQDLVGKRHWEEAWKIFGEVLLVSPNDRDALDGRKKITTQLFSEAGRLKQEGRFGSELEIAGLLKRLQPSAEVTALELETYEKWGDALLAARQYEQAVAKYDQALTIKPNDETLTAKKAKALAEKEKWLGVELVSVKGGIFEMGDKSGRGKADERPVHKVRVNDFHMSSHEITFQQFRAFRQPAHAGSGGADNMPVINVTWEEATAFCIWFSARTGVKVRLPTEAEWEYAAREGGKDLLWSGTSDSLLVTEYAWPRSISEGGRTHPIKQKRPNALGLYDMNGNAAEWCQDRYDDDYYQRLASVALSENPLGPDKGNKRVTRGGSSAEGPMSLRNTKRYSQDPSRIDRTLPTGFRVVVIF